MNNHHEITNLQLLKRKRISFINKTKHISQLYDQQTPDMSREEAFIAKRPLSDNYTQDENFVEKQSTCNSSEEVLSNSSGSKTYHHITDKRQFKYNNITYLEEDLFPDQDFISALFGESKTKTVLFNEESTLKPSPFKSQNNNNINASTTATVEQNLSKSFFPHKGYNIAKKLRKIILKNIKHKKIVPEPEDLEYLQMVKSKNAYVESIWTSEVFIQWKFKTDLHNKFTINEKSKISLYEKSNHTECIICLCKYQEGNDLKLIRQCGHAFHKECLDNWLKYNHVCPLDKNIIE